MATTKRTNIQQFKNRLSGGGARPNLFEVNFPSFPSGVESQYPGQVWTDNVKKNFRFMCKAAQMPGSSVPAISVPFRGRTLKVAGDRTYEDWTVTILNDESFDLRTAFEKWGNAIAKLDDGTGIAKPGEYMTNATVRQLGRGNILNNTDNNAGKGDEMIKLRTYTFVDLFPTEISPIELSYDSADTIEEFTVTFAYQYYTIGYKDDALTNADDPGSNNLIPKSLADQSEGTD
jgi:hypothetical protein